MRLILLIAFGGLLFGESKADWSNVKALAVGQEIRASMQDGKAYRGQVQSVTDDSLVMVAASSQETLDRAQVQKISTKGESHRGRNTLIGLGIGAGAGLGTGAIIDHSECNGHCWFGNDYGKAILTPLGAVVGTIIGVAWPTGRWRDVYKAK